LPGRRMFGLRFSGLALAGVAWLSLCLTPSLAQVSPATLAFVPGPERLKAGDQATFVLEVTDASRLNGIDIEITFDPTVVVLEDADPAREGLQATILPFVDPGFVVFNVGDNEKGRLRITYAQIGRSGVDGDGALVALRLRALSNGDPALAVSAALLARDDGSSQPIRLPSTGVALGVPSGSPAPNPTEILVPTETHEPSPSVSTQSSLTGVAPNAPSATSVSAPSGSSGGTSANWEVVCGIAAGAGGVAALAIGRRYGKRIGETE